jgi:FAD/FMN-containing dehydrogenase
VDVANGVAPTAQRQHVVLEATAVDALRARLRGSLLLPGATEYDSARSLWNAMIDRRPALIARCLGVADVVACVDFARTHDLPLSIKGGGHNIAGLAACDDGIMLDMSLMRGVWVDREARVARAQAGCLLGDVDRETQLHGLATVLGFISATGIAGLTVGGGMGYLTRRFGWTSDNVVSMEVVTADGRVVTASERENPDLFWALRGGGGNFGVVTGFEYALHPVGPEIIAGGIAWRAADAPEVLELYRELSASAPPELVLVAALRIAPPAPWLPKDVHGTPIVAIFVCHTGSLEEGRRLVQPLKTFGSPVGDIIQPRSYVSQQSLLDATQPKGRRYYWKSEYLPDVGVEFLATTIEHAKRLPSPHSAILVFPLDGALDRLPAGHSPVGNRDAAALVNIAAAWDDPAADAANIEWARSAWRDVRRFSTGGTYVNFLTADEGEERTRAAYGPHYERLAELKSKWDPGNLFRVNRNIAPRGAGGR